jgi:hypothetical protein
MKKISVFLIIHLLIIFLFFELHQRNREYNIVLTQNKSLNDSIGRTLISKRRLKTLLVKKIEHIKNLESELDVIAKLNQTLVAHKEMLQIELENELIKRKIAEEKFNLARDDMQRLNEQIARLNEEMKIYKDEIIAIYGIKGKGLDYEIKLSKKVELAKEGRVPCGKIVVVSKKYNFILFAPFNEKEKLMPGTSIEIYNSAKRLALGAVKDIRNNHVLVDNIIKYDTASDIKIGDMVVADLIK